MTEFDQSFPRAERLKQKRLFDTLFKGARRSFDHPLLALWKITELPEEVPVQVGFSVPVKLVRKANQRNRIKRWMREAYRTQNDSLHATLNDRQLQIALLLIMVKTDNISYEVLKEKIMLLLREIEDQIGSGG